jgi:hypothetical protein
LGAPDSGQLYLGTDGIVTARFVDPDYRMRMAIEVANCD